MIAHRHETRRLEPRRCRRHLDHGSDGVVIAERREGGEVARSLVWFKGHKAPAAGVRGFGHVYVPAQLAILDGRGYGVATVLSGGRLGRDRLLSIAEGIDAHLGKGATSLIRNARTLVIDADPCDSDAGTNREADA